MFLTKENMNLPTPEITKKAVVLLRIFERAIIGLQETQRQRLMLRKRATDTSIFNQQAIDLVRNLIGRNSQRATGQTSCVR